MPRPYRRFDAHPVARTCRGQVIVMVIAALAVLVTIVGLAIDIGHAWRARLKMQSAADAAAIAGTDALFNGSGVTPSAAAQAVATQNGFTNGAGTPINSNLVTVTVNNPPASGPNAGNGDAVEVIIAQAQPTYFLAMAGFTSLNASARAVAAIKSAPICMYSLNPAASGALNMAANTTVNSNCGVMVNSSSATALTGASGATISAPAVGVVGGISFSGSLPPNTSTGIAPASDPLAALPAPATGGSCTSLPAYGPDVTASIPAGFYCGLTIRSNTTINLSSSGTYSFNGNLDLSSNTTLNGTGVTLYFKSGSLTMSSNTTLTLSAPTSGTYAGIVLFEDRANTAPLSLSSNSGMTLTGTVYAPAANLTLASNAFSNVYSILVASTINIAANSTININADYSSLPGGSPIKTAVAVE